MTRLFASFKSPSKCSCYLIIESKTIIFYSLHTFSFAINMNVKCRLNFVWLIDLVSLAISISVRNKSPVITEQQLFYVIRLWTNWHHERFDSLSSAGSTFCCDKLKLSRTRNIKPEIDYFEQKFSKTSNFEANTFFGIWCVCVCVCGFLHIECLNTIVRYFRRRMRHAYWTIQFRSNYCFCNA